MALLAFSVNDVCNLKCSFCYVEHSGKVRRAAEKRNLDLLVCMGADTYVCIGKEPFLSPDPLLYVIQKVNMAEKEISIISNGIACESVFRKWDRKRENYHIDALDLTYHMGDDFLYERHFKQVVRGAHVARERVRRLSVLFVLCEEIMNYLDDAISFAENIGADRCIISPLSKPKRSAPYTKKLITPDLKKFFGLISTNSAFMKSQITCTVIDDFQFLLAGCSPPSSGQINDITEQFCLTEKVINIGDPFTQDELRLLDADILRDNPMIVHPMYRLNNAPKFRDGLPTIPIDGSSVEEVYRRLATEMSGIDLLKKVEECAI